ncbi:MAG TPA: C40 family peptidase [Chitinophagaceae bacterium]|nr:C40 family peptidase [Chitinophagaceae bacterium]
MKNAICIILLFGLLSCTELSQNNNVDRMREEAAARRNDSNAVTADTLQNNGNTNQRANIPANVNTGSTTPAQLMQFAEMQIGIPYVYGSSNPRVGFDCSGFITYVFNHFNIPVPRSSAGFTNVGKTINVSNAKRGDIILFTGTDSLTNEVGHMGLIIANNHGVVSFIHATSGRQMAVTISILDNYYKSRFMRVCRVFPQNG